MKPGKRALAVAFAALACCSPPRTQASLTDFLPSGDVASVSLSTLHLSPDGLGPARVGMTPQEAADALRAPLREAFPSGHGACVAYGLPDAAPDGGIAILAIQGRIQRVSIFASNIGVRTPEGIGIGSTEQEVRAAYPGVVFRIAPYDDPPAHDLIAWRHPESDGLRFDIDQHGRVVRMQGGAITYVEPCGA